MATELVDGEELFSSLFPSNPHHSLCCSRKSLTPRSSISKDQWPPAGSWGYKVPLHLGYFGSTAENDSLKWGNSNLSEMGFDLKKHWRWQHLILWIDNLLFIWLCFIFCSQLLWHFVCNVNVLLKSLKLYRIIQYLSFLTAITIMVSDKSFFPN